MRDITNLELATLISELQEAKGLFLDRFYEDGEGRFRFKLQKRGAQLNVLCILSKALNRTAFVQKSETPTSFAIGARNRIEGFGIEGIEQYNKDRIVLIRLQKGEERANVIIEMFGKGNLIIADAQMKVLLPYYTQEFKDRAIRKGVEYVPPKSAMMKETEPPKDHASYVYRDGSGKAVGFSLGKSEKYAGMKEQPFATLGEALDTIYYEEGMEEQAKPVKNPEAEELESSIAKQRKILKGMQDQIDEAQLKGSEIMGSMHEINEVIGAAQGNKRITKEELQRLFPKTRILSVDLKEKVIEIETETEGKVI